MTPGCPFCNPDPDRVFYLDPLVFGLWDGFPVAKGHALLVPRRHVASWFDATSEEQTALFAALETAKTRIEEFHRPHGFNIGININRAAGQTIFHLHIHLIPRYSGDVPDPTGGVRNVIPAKGNYLLKHSAHGHLVRGGQDPLLPRLLTDLDRRKHADLAVAFVQRSGVELIYDHLHERLERGGRIRFLTGDYLDVTDPDALTQLLDLRGDFELRAFVAGDTSFHPKGYIFYDDEEEGYAYVGSSNLTKSALGPGVEWNLRVDSNTSAQAFKEVRQAFNELFEHRSTCPVTFDWIESYRKRRQPDRSYVPAQPEPQIAPPSPHPVQREALEALEGTRAAGNAAGLVVLATGLGKTWLSAFDCQRPEFGRVLFIAHREEILDQARRTFRRIRPHARLGIYTGQRKDLDAEVLFASVQTLSRKKHLEAFEPHVFDYIVIDEFHHAAARTYRDIIDHFDPKFLLGLTATPERSDGGDLLSLCQENLVYRCDFIDGIQRDLLCPFQYYGVPDEVDYRNIPWRSSRFDEAALTEAVATQKRARNALDQYRARGGQKTLGFCCSQRHAEFMAEFFSENGIDSVAVHSGPNSAPRTASVEKLEKGEIKVVFAVDLFNEGLDVPSVDTVLMLRPTESTILWTQQFGRGLRKASGKILKVIDYIGNHRVFLVKIRSLLEPVLGQLSGDVQLSHALDRALSGELELPPECSVTYDLESIDLIRKLLRAKGVNAAEIVYSDFRERHGRRPTAAELYHEGYNPKSLRSSYGSWFGFVKQMGDLTSVEEGAAAKTSHFLAQLEITSMTKSYKMLLLQAMLNLDGFPGKVGISELVHEFRRLAARSKRLREDVGDPLEDDSELKSHLERNPIQAWTGGRATGDRVYFTYAEGVLAADFDLEGRERSAFQDLVRELTDLRLAEYLDRFNLGTPGGLVGKVSHAGSRPMVFLPDRARHEGIPFGEIPLTVEGTVYRAMFVKVALNVVRPPDSERNVLPQLLRTWFGADAGRPGTNHEVYFSPTETGWEMTRSKEHTRNELEVWKTYSREEIPTFFGLTFNTGKWNQGFVTVPGHVFLLGH